MTLAHPPTRNCRLTADRERIPSPVDFAPTRPGTQLTTDRGFRQSPQTQTTHPRQTEPSEGADAPDADELAVTRPQAIGCR